MDDTTFVKEGSKLLADYIDSEIGEAIHEIGHGVNRDSIATCMRDKEIAFHCLRSVMFSDEQSEAIARSRIRDILRGVVI